MQETFFMKTYGCQMNVHDSLRMSNLLKKEGFNEVFDIRSAQIIIFNTCSIRGNARNKVLSDIGFIQKERLACAKDLFIAVGGCVSTHDKENLIKGNRKIDLVFGPDQISKLPLLLKECLTNKRKKVDVNFTKSPFSYAQDEIKHRHEDGLTPKGAAHISIIKGCNNFCSFCIVPFTRGREKSRKISDIEAEAKFLISSGVKELILLGQNVNTFGKDSGENFIHLIKRIDGLGIKRLRFITPHPKDLSDNLIEAFFELESLCNYLHLPVQSGSSKILKRMNRKYDREKYLSLINKFRKKDSGFVFGTDIIVGFPGETDSDFKDTLSLLKEVEYENIFSFKYSPREGTSAAIMTDSVEEKIKEERLAILNELQAEIRKINAQKKVGEKWEILAESESKYKSNSIGGRSREFRYVNFSAPKETIGEFVNVKITAVSDLTYKGVMC